MSNDLWLRIGFQIVEADAKKQREDKEASGAERIHVDYAKSLVQIALVPGDSTLEEAEVLMLAVTPDGSPGPVAPVDRIGAWLALTRDLWSDEDMTPELINGFRQALFAVLGAYQPAVDLAEAVDEFLGAAYPSVGDA